MMQQQNSTKSTTLSKGLIRAGHRVKLHSINTMLNKSMDTSYTECASIGTDCINICLGEQIPVFIVPVKGFFYNKANDAEFEVIRVISNESSGKFGWFKTSAGGPFLPFETIKEVVL